MSSPSGTLRAAFDSFVSDAARSAAACDRLIARMQEPPRFYHYERHIAAVLDCLNRWSRNAPSAALTAAALYHDAIYDAKRQDNEELSAEFCREQLMELGAPIDTIARAEHLILLTKKHQPNFQDREEVLMLDADLYILGASPEEYTAYIQGIRAEYAHVPDDGWRTGRGAFLKAFLKRPHIFHGDWSGRDEREAKARINLATELSRLHQ